MNLNVIHPTAVLDLVLDLICAPGSGQVHRPPVRTDEVTVARPIPLNGKAPLMHQPMVGGAQGQQVGQGRLTPVGPVLDMVGIEIAQDGRMGRLILSEDRRVE